MYILWTIFFKKSKIMGTKYKGKIKEVSSLNTYIKLVRATETLRTKLINKLFDFKITENQFYCLDAIYHLGPLTQRELGEKLSRSGGNITLVIDNLEKKHLVKRQKDKDDRRKYFIVLTKKGENFFKKLFPHQLNLLVDELNSISEKDKKELQRLCKKIGLKN